MDVQVIITVRDASSTALITSVELSPGLDDMLGAPPSREHMYAVALMQELDYAADGLRVLKHVADRVCDVPEGQWAPSLHPALTNQR
jgi:hypothetical protein